MTGLDLMMGGHLLGLWEYCSAEVQCFVAWAAVSHLLFIFRQFIRQTSMTEISENYDDRIQIRFLSGRNVSCTLTNR